MAGENASIEPVNRQDSSRRRARGKGVNRGAVLARREAFLKAYSECANITAAADAIGMARSQHFVWMADEGYRKQFEQACARYHDTKLHTLTTECDRRAMAGSDTLLIFRLKKLDPSYREHYKVDVSTKADVYDVDAMTKLALTEEGRQAIRQLSDMIDEQAANQAKVVS